MHFLKELSTFFVEYSSEIFQRVAEHLFMCGIVITAVIFTAVPLGILIARFGKISGLVLSITNILYTIPALALFGMLIPVVGIGSKPAVIALFIYCLLPLTRNTYTGILGVDPALVEAARGMGASSFQVLFRIELPLAFPVILAGIRTMTVMTIGIATIAALIGGGGLGNFIVTGIYRVYDVMIIAGTVLIAFLAVLADRILGLLERKLYLKLKG